MKLPGSCRLFLLLGFAMVLPQTGQASLTIRIHLLYYENANGKLSNGHHCETKIWPMKRTECDPLFTINVKVDEHSFRTKMKVKDQNVIYFGSTIDGQSNPLVYRIGTFHGDAKINIEVHDFDMVSRNDYIGSFSYDLSHWRPQLFTEPILAKEVLLRDSQRPDHIMKLKIFLRCDRDYYGQFCQTYCQYKRNSVDGYFDCDEEGAKQCLPTYDPSVGCRKTFCLKQPCKNGGTCKDLANGFLCQCQKLFGGPTCEQKVRACLHDAPCRNGGTCMEAESPSGDGKCKCAPGYHGDACERDINECQVDSSLCQGNESKCVNWFGSYTCHCGPGRRGRHCQVDVDECVELPATACLNGGTCQNTLGGYLCHCPDGYRGDRCEDDIDECSIRSSSSSKNRTVKTFPCNSTTQVCRNLDGSFACICRPGFSGPNCSIASDRPKNESDSSEFQGLATILRQRATVLIIGGVLLVGCLIASAVPLVQLLKHIKRRAKRRKFSANSNSAVTDNPVYDVHEADTHDAIGAVYAEDAEETTGQGGRAYDQPEEEPPQGRRKPSKKQQQPVRPPPLPPRPSQPPPPPSSNDNGCYIEPISRSGGHVANSAASSVYVTPSSRLEGAFVNPPPELEDGSMFNY